MQKFKNTEEGEKYGGRKKCRKKENAKIKNFGWRQRKPYIGESVCRKLGPLGL